MRHASLLLLLLGLAGPAAAGPAADRMKVAEGLFGKREYFTRRVLRIWGRPLRLIRGGPKPGAGAPPRDR